MTGGGEGSGKAYCLGIAREGGTAVADIDEKAADGVAKAIILVNGGAVLH